MPPKQKKSNNQGGEEEDQQSLQAVILTDFFEEQFQPISYELPRCLMPVCNIPLIEYTMEMLAAVDVFEVFVVCINHIEAIKNYFEHSEWMKANSRLTVQIVAAPECLSVGDALRELDARQLITADFILTSGELVSNIKLDVLLEEHRALKKVDKNYIMTMVLKEASRTHSSRPKDSNSVFVLNPKNKQCLYYEPVVAFPRQSRLEISPEIFENSTEIEFRNDLVDPCFDICSLEVPALFTENFDWQRLRSDFVHGILTSDILGKTIYSNIVFEPYIARVQNEQLYDTISKHILSRWVFPVVPETNLRPGDDYEFTRGNIYKSTGVKLSRSCMIDDNVQIGSGTVIGENTRVSNTVIGKNCIIGDNVTLENAYLWDNVTIKNNASVYKSIIANGVNILENTSVEKGCLISINVTVGPNKKIAKYSRLSRFPQPKDTVFAESDDEIDQKHEAPKATKGNQPVYYWTLRTADADEDIRNNKLGSLAFDMADLVLNEDDLTDSASEIGDSDSDSEIGSINGAWALESSIAKKTEEFKREISQTIERSLNENHSVYTAALEVTGLRMSSNGSYTDIREVMIPIIMDHIDRNNAIKSMKTVLNKWAPLIKKMTHTPEDQMHVLHVLHTHCTKEEYLNKLFLGALQLIYNADIVEEDAIRVWYASDKSRATPALTKLREKATKFIEWLDEAEEESEEESDDE
ncbi:hypothetical protein BDB01DRAFT_802670 [Pilobolus umbonatus]|nr:hypothetical protein BDB01DRAFT_802670 [Pilobolus umbonatus]